ncbi:SDR family NAD(P)-dependent oxidoreductase [Rhodohalobacter mucosus]|uniref:Short-chain dehydrogenase n=1 Tax=Rhodohalobacter mucosus TaxID=2079485 RepID=A0A316TSV9_9BACT|nr:SDR family oxidoreductase [Rhodohalobacter mucosus]PWN06429.1 short-chain dehydrogenase [Rhodohalobacter mucosus]
MKETALITGASSGIGMELARVFAREGYNLLITARREEKLRELANHLEEAFRINVICLAADLSTPESPREVYDFAVSNNLNVTVLINNAGIGDYGFFHRSDWDKTATMIDLNMRSLTHLTRLFLPDLISKQRSYIMNVASTAAFQPGPLMSVYYASKQYVLAFGEAIDNELNHTGVHVTTLCPGPVKTEFQDTANMQKSKLVDRIPMAEAEDVAEYGYKAMMKGKRVAIHGFQNKISSVIVRWLPRRLVTWSVRKLQERTP